MKNFFLSGNRLSCKSRTLFYPRGLCVRIRLTVLLCSLLGLQLSVSHPGSGQAVDDEIVTVEALGEFLPQVLKSIERQTDYRFAYNAGLIGKYQVDLVRGNRSLQ